MSRQDEHNAQSDETQPRSRTPARKTVISIALVLGALLPVALLSLFAYRLASNRIHQLTRAGNAAAASMTSELVRSDMSRSIDMARALAAQPGMIAAVQRRDADAVRDRLRAMIEAVHRHDGPATTPATTRRDAGRRVLRAFVTDPAGTQWSDYPSSAQTIGQNFSDRDWYRGVTRNWETYLSEAYLRAAKPRIMVVAIATPVRDTTGKAIGILVFQIPLDYLSQALRSIQVGGTGHVYVVDRRGTVAAHPNLDLSTQMHTQAANNAQVKSALAGQSSIAEYDDPISKERMVAAFEPLAVPDGMWAAIAQQPKVEVVRPLRRLAAGIALAASILAIGAGALVSVLRRASLRDQRLSDELEVKRQRQWKLAEQLRATVDSERAARIEIETAHKELRQTQSRLVQSEKLAALGQLVAGVAHEINNPLAFVLNNVAILQRDVKLLDEVIRLYQSGEPTLEKYEPELRRRLKELSDDIDLPYTLTEIAEIPMRSREGLIRIQQIVKDLRDFARQNAVGDLQDGADLNPGIESTLNIARGLAKKHKVVLEADLAPLPGITCSPGKINQVVLNLITNAIHASPEESSVIVRTRESAGGVLVQVIDSGSGIAPEIRERIFDPFFTTKPQGQGTGLGLSISHGIVTEHGGRIEVESEVGKGTMVGVWLPATPPGKRGRADGAVGREGRQNVQLSTSNVERPTAADE